MSATSKQIGRSTSGKSAGRIALFWQSAFSGHRTVDAVSLVLVISACAVLPFKLLGASFDDLTSVWLPSSDLMGWYIRGLGFHTNGEIFYTNALGFPGVQEAVSSRVSSFDGVQELMQAFFVFISQDPILGTNLFLVSQFVLTGTLSFLLLRSMSIIPALSSIFAIPIAVMPYTMVQISRPNIAFLWPYVAAMLLSGLVLYGRGSARRNVSVVTLTAFVAASGGYSIAFIALTTVPAMVIILTFNHLWSRERLKVLAISTATTISVIAAQLVSHSRSGLIPSAPVRGAAEFADYQGWNASLFMPTQFSGFSAFRDFGLSVFNNVYLKADPGSFCMSDLALRDSYQEISCHRLAEKLAFPSGASIIGLYIALAGVLMLVARLSRSGSNQRTSHIPTPLRSRSPMLSSIVISAFFATVVSSFGLSLFIGALLPSLRMWGRIQATILLSCTAILAVLLSNLIVQRVTWRPSRRLILAAVIAFILIDQGGYSLNSVSKWRAEQAHYRTISAILRANTASECGMVVMPSRQMGLPDQLIHGAKYSSYYDQLLALYEPTLRWSGGEPLGQTPSADPTKSIWPNGDAQPLQQQISEAVNFAVHAGACGYVFDTSSGSAVSSRFTVYSIKQHLLSKGIQAREVSAGPLTTLFWTP